MDFSKGDKVQMRSDRGRVGIVERVERVYGGQQYYRVFWGGPHGTRVVAEIDLVPFVENPSIRDLLANGEVAGYAAFQRTMTLHRLVRDHPLRNNIYAFNASRTRFYPYQFKPLMKLLDSPNHRLLICDEVGLGKTIEAGLILCELRARQELRTVLVVCPSALTTKWKLELDRRFEEDFRVYRSKDFDEFLQEYEDQPDRKELGGIVALESIRTPGVLERLEALNPSFDLVVVDEAHHVRNMGTKSRRAVAALADGAGALLMLTATPVHLGTHNLFSLLNLLDEQDFPDGETAERRFAENEPIVRVQRALGSSELWRSPDALAATIEDLDAASASKLIGEHPLFPGVRRAVAALAELDDSTVRRAAIIKAQRDLADLNLLGHIFTRTRKRDVQTRTPVRQAKSLMVTFTPRERAVYDSVTELIKAESEQRGSMPFIDAFRLHMPQRRMASSIHAMVEHYRAHDPFELGDLPEEDTADLDVESSGQDLMNVKARLRRIISSWSDETPDTKLEQLLATLTATRDRETGSRILVFATFRATLEYLARRLRAAGFGTEVIHGGVPTQDRNKIIQRFREGNGIEVLLSSRVGSEGLDFEFCSTIVNYDLPWNPVELEQRIGRLDRIGQESPTITILNLAVDDTVETRILLRLYERIGIFRRAIGDLEEIMGDLTRKLEATFLSGRLTSEEEERRLEQILVAAEQRRLDLERLESDSSRFLGSDAFFEDEIAAIGSRKRYVTALQLQRFLTDYLETYARGTRLLPTERPNVMTLIPDQQLRSFLQASGHAGNLISLLGAGREGRAITFDSETAFQAPGLEFINVRHPMILAIAEFYRDAMAEQNGAYHVALPGGKAPIEVARGRHLLLIYRLRVTGARGGASLETVVVSLADGRCFSGEVGETLLGAVVESGQEPQGVPLQIDPARLDEAIDVAGTEFTRLLSERREGLEMTNNALVDRRVASYETWYEKRVRQQQDRLRTGRQERYMRMVRGTLARLEAERAKRLGELGQARAISVEYDELGIAVVDVVA